MLRHYVASVTAGSKSSGKCGKHAPLTTKHSTLATKPNMDPGSSNSWTKNPVNNFYEKALSSTENFSCKTFAQARPAGLRKVTQAKTRCGSGGPRSLPGIHNAAVEEFQDFGGARGDF